MPLELSPLCLENEIYGCLKVLVRFYYIYLQLPGLCTFACDVQENEQNRSVIMKKWCTGIGRVVVFFLCAHLIACSVDNGYDLSKDVDLTVAVGQGIAIPLGSTERIMLSDMIDTDGIIAVDDDGSYVIRKNGSFDAVEFVVDEVKGMHLGTDVEEQYYSMELEEVYDSYDEAIAGINSSPYLTDEQKQQFIDELNSNKVAVSLYEKIDKNDIEFNFSKDDFPKELKRIYRVEFDEPVRMRFQVDVTCDADMELFEVLDSLELSTAGLDDGSFYISIPDYIEFVEHDDVHDDRLYLRGAVGVSADRTKFTKSWEFHISALDFKGGREIVDGAISIVDKLVVNGALKSNMVMVEVGSLVNGLRTFDDVAFAPKVEISDFDIRNVVAAVEVDIDDLDETVGIELDEDLDFLYEEGTVMDFSNPQIVLNVDNNSAVAVESDISLKGLDEYGCVIEGSDVSFGINVEAAAANSYLVTNGGIVREGCTPVKADLSQLFKRLPHSIAIGIKSVNDGSEPVSLTLGTTMSVSGGYEVNIPLEFNELALKYTWKVEDVLGDDADEITGYIKDVGLVTLEAEVLNCIPAGLVPALRAYDADGNLLSDVVAYVNGKVAAGNGMVDGRLSAPVSSVFKVGLSATGDGLSRLNTIEVDLEGRGSGQFNSNEYIKIEKMSLTIDRPVEIDLN